MIRFAFSVYDPDGMGHIQMAEVEELLKMIHGPGFEVFANQALAQFAADDRDNLVKFDEFVEMNVRFPNLLYPVSRSTAAPQHRAPRPWLSTPRHTPCSACMLTPRLLLACFSMLLAPPQVFRTQHKCYTNFMGVSWWERRKTIFHDARMHMSGEDIANKDREEQARRNAWAFRQPAKKKTLGGLLGGAKSKD